MKCAPPIARGLAVAALLTLPGLASADPLSVSPSEILGDDRALVTWTLPADAAVPSDGQCGFVDNSPRSPINFGSNIGVVRLPAYSPGGDPDEAQTAVVCTASPYRAVVNVKWQPRLTRNKYLCWAAVGLLLGFAARSQKVASKKRAEGRNALLPDPTPTKPDTSNVPLPDWTKLWYWFVEPMTTLSVGLIAGRRCARRRTPPRRDHGVGGAGDGAERWAAHPRESHRAIPRAETKG